MLAVLRMVPYTYGGATNSPMIIRQPQHHLLAAIVSCTSNMPPLGNCLTPNIAAPTPTPLVPTDFRLPNYTASTNCSWWTSDRARAYSGRVTLLRASGGRMDRPV